jgi:hypothetical protein
VRRISREESIAVDKGKARKAAVKGAAIELAKRVPVIKELIGGAKAYEDSIKDQQREAFVNELSSRVEKIRENIQWYQTDEGQTFVKKIVATALNAEYADKLEYLANALGNGPKLGNDDARRQKYTEMIRQLSRPALNVLVASLQHPTGTGQVIASALAEEMDWDPAIVDACVQELYASGHSLS